MWTTSKKYPGIDIWVDDETGKVTRGTAGSGFDYRTVYPYKRANGGLDNCAGEYTLKQIEKKAIAWN